MCWFPLFLLQDHWWYPTPLPTLPVLSRHFPDFTFLSKNFPPPISLNCHLWLFPLCLPQAKMWAPLCLPPPETSKTWPFLLWTRYAFPILRNLQKELYPEQDPCVILLFLAAWMQRFPFIWSLIQPLGTLILALTSLTVFEVAWSSSILVISDLGLVLVSVSVFKLVSGLIKVFSRIFVSGFVSGIFFASVFVWVWILFEIFDFSEIGFAKRKINK